MNSWQELTIHVHRDAEEAVSNLMIETGSQGWPLATRLTMWDRRTVLVNFIPRWSSRI